MVKKIVLVLGILAIGVSVYAFTPAGAPPAKPAAAQEDLVKKEIDALKIQVADLNLRVTKLEAAMTPPPPPPPPQKPGGFKPAPK